MSRTPKPYAFLLALAALAAASSARVEAQEFRIEEATSLAALAIEGLKPKTIAFVDRPSDELIDPDVGLRVVLDELRRRRRVAGVASHLGRIRA